MKPVVDEVVPLAEARAAHERLESGRQFGKIVLVPQEPLHGRFRPMTVNLRRVERYRLYEPPMSFARLSLSLAAVIGVIATALAGATIWLLIAQPVAVADAVATGDVSPLMRALAGALYDALEGIVKYL